MGYFWLLATVVLTVYGQLAFKWRIDESGEFPAGGRERVEFAVRFLIDPWVISVFAAALLASGTWAAALTRFELSFAYPFMALSFVLVLLFSALLFSEGVTAPKLIGVTLIVAGLAIGSQT